MKKTLNDFNKTNKLEEDIKSYICEFVHHSDDEIYANEITKNIIDTINEYTNNVIQLTELEDDIKSYVYEFVYHTDDETYANEVTKDIINYIKNL